MDYQQSDEKSEKISEILKSVYDWLEKLIKVKDLIKDQMKILKKYLR